MICAPTIIYFVGSSLTECISCIRTDQRIAREPELTFDEIRRAAGMLNVLSDKNKGTHREGEGTTPTCNHGLPRRSLRRVNVFTSQAGKRESDD